MSESNDSTILSEGDTFVIDDRSYSISFDYNRDGEINYFQLTDTNGEFVNEADWEGPVSVDDIKALMFPKEKSEEAASVVEVAPESYTQHKLGDKGTVCEFLTGERLYVPKGTDVKETVSLVDLYQFVPHRTDSYLAVIDGVTWNLCEDSSYAFADGYPDYFGRHGYTPVGKLYKLLVEEIPDLLEEWADEEY